MTASKGSRGRCRCGSSLLDIMISTALLLTIFIFACSEFPTATRAITHNSHYLAASFLAEQVLERTRHLDFPNVVAASGSQVVSGMAAASLEQATLLYATSVSTLNNRLKDVVVTVTWNELGGTRRLVVETLVSKDVQ